MTIRKYMITENVLDKILAKSIVSSNGCWEWLACKSSRGVPLVIHKGKHVSALKASYESQIGLIKKGEYLYQSCENTNCVNPEHLVIETSTRKINKDQTTLFKLSGVELEILKIRFWAKVRSDTDSNKCWEWIRGQIL